MRRYLAACALTLLLAGCAHQTPDAVPLEQQVVQRTEYVIRIPPAELLTLPPKPANINPDTADQATVAQWLLGKEQYTYQIENQLKGIAQFFQTTQTQLDTSAATQNTQFKALADKAQAQETVDAANKKVDLSGASKSSLAPLPDPTSVLLNKLVP